MDQTDRDMRQAAFNSLPPRIRELLTDEEKTLFLTSETWPDTLFEKLSEFIVKGEQGG